MSKKLSSFLEPEITVHVLQVDSDGHVLGVFYMYSDLTNHMLKLLKSNGYELRHFKITSHTMKVGNQIKVYR